VTGSLELAGRRVDELSGGQRQRVWIAMALAQDTDVLLLDEPTTYLDVTHQVEVLDLLVDLNRTRGTTVVLVLHDLNLPAATPTTSSRCSAAGSPPPEHRPRSSPRRSSSRSSACAAGSCPTRSPARRWSSPSAATAPAPPPARARTPRPEPLDDPDRPAPAHGVRRRGAVRAPAVTELPADHLRRALPRRLRAVRTADLRIKLLIPSPGHSLPDLRDLSDGWYAAWLALDPAVRGSMRTTPCARCVPQARPPSSTSTWSSTSTRTDAADRKLVRGTVAYRGPAQGNRGA
jgi:hypothetical protein